MQAEGDCRVRGSSLLSPQQHAAMLQRSWQTAASLPTPMEQRSWMSRILTWTGAPPLSPSPVTEWILHMYLCSP